MKKIDFEKKFARSDAIDNVFKHMTKVKHNLLILAEYLPKRVTRPAFRAFSKELRRLIKKSKFVNKKR